MTTTETRLFARYRETDDLCARRELIERFLPLARRLARRYCSAHDADDLEQVASLGLVKAVDRYDPQRGTSFASFAIPTILGELKRHFRDAHWALHVPRALQERAQAVAREVDRQVSLLGRAPTLRELADALGANVEDVIEAQAAVRGRDTMSLDAPAADGEGDFAGEWLGVAEPGYELVRKRTAVAPALASLSDRERTLLRLRFEDDMTQREIGSRLGISQMQVSRLLRASLERVREEAGV